MIDLWGFSIGVNYSRTHDQKKNKTTSDKAFWDSTWWGFSKNASLMGTVSFRTSKFPYSHTGSWTPDPDTHRNTAADSQRCSSTMRGTGGIFLMTFLSGKTHTVLFSLSSLYMTWLCLWNETEVGVGFWLWWIIKFPIKRWNLNGLKLIKIQTSWSMLSFLNIKYIIKIEWTLLSFHSVLVTVALETFRHRC